MFDQLTASWDDFLAVNFMGIINASNAVVPYLWEQRHGSIVNISSTAAFPLPLPAMFAAGDDVAAAHDRAAGLRDDEVDGHPPDPPDGADARVARASG